MLCEASSDVKGTRRTFNPVPLARPPLMNADRMGSSREAPAKPELCWPCIQVRATPAAEERKSDRDKRGNISEGLA